MKPYDLGHARVQPRRGGALPRGGRAIAGAGNRRGCRARGRARRPNPSAIYLVAVVATAVASGPWGAAAASVAAFLLYNFLFVEPRYTLDGREPRRAGQPLPAPVRRVRRRPACRSAAGPRGGCGCARARSPCTVPGESRTGDACLDAGRAAGPRRHPPRPGGHGSCLDHARRRDARERVAADTAGDSPRPDAALHHVLQRMPGETPATWARVHVPAPPGSRSASGSDVYRVRIEAGGEGFGSVWASACAAGGRAVDEPRPGCSPRPRTRWARHCARTGSPREAQAAEIARQSDALKSALLQSVSHDLRTPLATIRAAAGTLRPNSRPQRGGPAGERRRDRSRGRIPEPTRDEPPRPVAASRPARCAPNATCSSWTTSSARRSTGLRPRLGGPTDRRVAGGAPRRGRPGLRRRGSNQRPRERDQVHRAGDANASWPASTGGDGMVRLTDRGRRRGRPGRCPAEPLRKVLPGPGRPGRLPLGHRDRPRSGPGADRGDGRPRRRPPERPRRARHRPRPAGCAATVAGPDRGRGMTAGRRRPRAAPTVLVVEDDEETRRVIVRELAARGYRRRRGA